jgi:gliding motility-associated-like protein
MRLIKSILLAVAITSAALSWGQTTESFTVTGTTNWVVPPCVTEITVEAWGGGGGGGGAWSKNNQSVTVFSCDCTNEACAGAGGGGGGGYTRQTYSVTSGDIYAVTVGAGGLGGTSVATPTNSSSVQDGQQGGNSSFVGGVYNLIAFGGGGGGKAFAFNPDYTASHFRVNGVAGVGGSGNGTIVFNGGNGHAGQTGGSFDFSGAGGGGAGTTQNGFNGNAPVSNNPMVGGAGGSQFGGKGGDGKRTSSNVAAVGNSGVIIGGGGAGGLTHQTGFVGTARTAAGGPGARGEVRITYTISGTAPAQPSAIVGPNPIGCAGASGTYSVTNVPGVSYAWSYSGTGNITGTGNSINLEATTGGTLTVTPSNGCGNGPSQQIVITVNTVPAQPSAIAGSTSICAGTANYSVTNVPGVTYTWTYSGTGTLTPNGNQVDLNATTGGTLTVTPSNACGNGPAQQIAITIGDVPAQPSAIAGSTSICAGTANYSVTNVPGVTYTWTYSGTGTLTPNGNQVDLNATTGGTLTVTPSNACGNGPAQQIAITIGDVPAQPSEINGSTSICAGSANYSVTSVPGVTYTWTYSGAGTLTPNGNQVDLNATTGGTLTVTPSNACGNGPSQQIAITIEDVPNQPVTITGPDVIGCATSSGNYSVTAESGVTYTWTYSGTGTITGTGNSISLEPTSGGTLTVTPSNACGNGISQTVDVQFTASDLEIEATELNGVSCNGNADGSAILEISGGTAPYTIVWNPAVASGLSASNLTAGNYTVTVTDENGCVAEVTFTISSPAPLNVQMSGSPTDCGSSNGTVNTLVSGGTGPFTYSWNPDNGNASSLSGLSAGNYSVSITDDNGCTASGSYTVQLSDNLNVYIDPESAVIDAGESVQLNTLISPDNALVTYTWTPVNGLSCTDCPDPVASPTQTTTYIVIASTSDGCTASDTITIFVNPTCGEHFIPTIFSPNGDGHNDEFKVFGNCIATLSLQVYDRWGELVFETDSQNIGWDGTFRGKMMNSAVYVYKAEIIFSDGTTIAETGNLNLVR